jgi:hypothetical protein
MPQTDKHLTQSPFTCQFLKITTFGIAFYQSNLSTGTLYAGMVVDELLQDRICWGQNIKEQSVVGTDCLRMEFIGDGP